MNDTVKLLRLTHAACAPTGHAMACEDEYGHRCGCGLQRYAADGSELITVIADHSCEHPHPGGRYFRAYAVGCDVVIETGVFGGSGPDYERDTMHTALAAQTGRSAASVRHARNSRWSLSRMFIFDVPPGASNEDLTAKLDALTGRGSTVTC